MSPLEVLRKYWGHKNFREPQESIINNVLNKKDSIALLPTGGGKSLCYQLPAVILEGATLVVSPLIALMEDQVKELNERGIKAMFLESHSNALPLSKQLDNCTYGNYKLIYISPERLTNKEFIERIKSVDIDLIAVDEAHCISEWGHDFRPAYRKINNLRDVFPKVPVIALTASATSTALNDIKTELNLIAPVIFKKSFERKNIFYEVLETENKFGSLLRELKTKKYSSVIIYCKTRKDTEKINALLLQNEISSVFFHGGITAAEKKEKLNKWKCEKAKIIVATTAFGMGINKNNVHLVVHFSLPDSLENYYQETGRAGRDGKPSKALLLFHPGDPEQFKNRVLKYLPDRKVLRECYKHLCNYLQIARGEGKNQLYEFNFKDFCDTYNLSLRTTLECLQILDREGVFKMQNLLINQLQIEIKASQQTVVEYIKSSSPAGDILQYLLRNCQNLFSKSIDVDLNSISIFFKCSAESIIEQFEILQKNQILRFVAQKKDIQLTGLTPREDEYTLRPALNKLELRNAIKKEKIEKVLHFAFDKSQCKRNLLLNYFSEYKKSNCRNCSAACCSKRDINLPIVKTAVIEALREESKTVHELKDILRFRAEELKAVLYQLQETNVIRITRTNKFTLNK